MRGDAPDVVDLEGGSVLIAVERLFVMHVQEEEKRLYIVENAME